MSSATRYDQDFFAWANEQAALRSHGRRNSVRVQRIGLDSFIRDNPSLMSVRTNAVAEAYRIARIEAEGETGIPETTFPPVCPWSFGQIMDDDFRPGGN